MAKQLLTASAGAQAERDAQLKHLQARRRKVFPGNAIAADVVAAELDTLIKWVKTRKARFDRKTGGLGK